MSLKKAHRLTPARALEPKSIEKTSVKSAYVFSESTRDALQFNADNEGKPQWAGTAAFF